jgi:hypothetical protein
MDADARPVCRHAERISISAKALTVDAAGDTYQITGVDPAVALRFLSSCDGTLSIADICEKHSIPIDIASAIVESCRDIQLLYLNLPPLADIAADFFLNILRQRYAVWNTELFSQLLWRFLLSGKAERSLVNGWLLESYHFIRGASARLAYATSLSNDERVTPYFLDHHLEEYDHYGFFEDALRRRNVKFADAVPLPSTEAIINFARMAARRSPLHYMACSGLLESSGSDTTRAVEFYRTVATYYDEDQSGFTEPLLAHVLLDQEYQHGSICARILRNFDRIETRLANDVLDTAERFKDTIVYWFKDVYRTYASAGRETFGPRSREYYRATGRGFE